MSLPTNSPSSCDCALPQSIPRRRFLKTTAAGLAVAAASKAWMPHQALAGPTPNDVSETLAAQLYKSLSEEQRRTLCFDFGHPLREKVDNNWLITKKSIQDVLKPDQRDLVEQIFRRLHAPEFADRAMQRDLEILPHNCAWLVGRPRNRSALHESEFRPGVHSATNVPTRTGPQGRFFVARNPASLRVFGPFCRCHAVHKCRPKQPEFDPPLLSLLHLPSPTRRSWHPQNPLCGAELRGCRGERLAAAIGAAIGLREPRDGGYRDAQEWVARHGWPRSVALLATAT